MKIIEDKAVNHRYEVDIIRGFTIASVIGMHTVATITYVDTNAYGSFIQYLIVLLLRYNRQTFIFITAFVLVYVYNKPGLKFLNFLRKRALTIIIPYILWSILYVFLYTPNATIGTYLFDIFTGSAYYQLYYIMLAIQLYLILPYFIKILNKLKDKTLISMIIIFILQFVVMFYDYYIMNLSNLTKQNTIVNTILTYQDRFIFMYFAYIFLGGFAAIHINTFEKKINEKKLGVILFFILSLISLIISYIIEVKVFNLSIFYASAFMQPLVITYSISIILMLFYLSINFIKKTKKKHEIKILNFILILSEASFGLYLIHPIILNIVNYILSTYLILPNTFLPVLIGWIATLGISLGIVVLFLKTPYLRVLIGKYNKKTKLLNT
jgi:membrane-bound acyltransferase YfiQ involved in biofilm formation